MKSRATKTSRAKQSFQRAVKGTKKKASHVGGGDVNWSYDPAEKDQYGYDGRFPIDADQDKHGKGHQEEVHKGDKTDGGAHFVDNVDKRDEAGKATASSKSMEKTARDLRVVAATLARTVRHMADSYVGGGEISNSYDPAEEKRHDYRDDFPIDADQDKHGKGHQEEVHKGDKTDGGAHFVDNVDKRDEAGKATAHSEGMKKLGQALLMIEKEADDGKLSKDQQATLADTFKALGRDFDHVIDSESALTGEYKNDSEILVSGDGKETKKQADDDWMNVPRPTGASEKMASDDEWLSVEAAGHPLEDGDRIHTKYQGRQVDSPSMDYERWFAPSMSIGGEFEDPRDEAAHATARDTAKYTT